MTSRSLRASIEKRRPDYSSVPPKMGRCVELLLGPARQQLGKLAKIRQAEKWVLPRTTKSRETVRPAVGRKLSGARVAKNIATLVDVNPCVVRAARPIKCGAPTSGPFQACPEPPIHMKPRPENRCRDEGRPAAPNALELIVIPDMRQKPSNDRTTTPNATPLPCELSEQDCPRTGRKRIVPPATFHATSRQSQTKQQIPQTRFSSDKWQPTAATSTASAWQISRKVPGISAPPPSSPSTGIREQHKSHSTRPHAFCCPSAGVLPFEYAAQGPGCRSTHHP